MSILSVLISCCGGEIALPDVDDLDPITSCDSDLQPGTSEYALENRLAVTTFLPPTAGKLDTRRCVDGIASSHNNTHTD